MQFGWGACHNTIGCIVTGGGLNGWWTVSRYTVLYRDRDKGLVVGGTVSRYSLCIVTSGQPGCGRVKILLIVS